MRENRIIFTDFELTPKSQKPPNPICNWMSGRLSLRLAHDYSSEKGLVNSILYCHLKRITDPQLRAADL